MPQVRLHRLDANPFDCAQGGLRAGSGSRPNLGNYLLDSTSQGGDDDEGGGWRIQRAASLVRSLFCGLPHQERRMAIFVSGSDETQGGEFFHHAGLIASENDWSNIFVPAWQTFVLDREPKIPYLHMTDIRSREWREKYGLSPDEAELRVNAAINIIKSVRYLFQICSTVNTAEIRALPSLQFRKDTHSRKKRLKEDHVCFSAYVFTVLDTVARLYPNCEKVDFVIERKTGISEELVELYRDFSDAFAYARRPDLSKLLGDVIPAGKERIPLQGADVLAWHSQRAVLKTLEAIDAQRYEALYWGRGTGMSGLGMN